MIQLVKKILQKHNITYNTLTKSQTGFSNEVYFVDDKYIVKIAPEPKRYQKLLNEIGFYSNANFDFIPKSIASGECEEKPYIIMQQLHGKTVYSIWHTLSEEQRENIVCQICNILKNIHSMQGDFLRQKHIMPDMVVAFKKSFDYNMQLLKDRGFDTKPLKKVYKKLDTIFAQKHNGLVYNDAHFDNFLLCGDKVYIIDFDRMRYCSIDFELLIIKSMLDNPCKFACEQDEPNVKDQDYANVMQYYKKYYPELFDFEYLNDRVFIYQFLYRLGHGYEYNRNEWIEEEINKLKQYFGV